MSESVQPHGWQPTRLPRPWDSPGKNTGVGCHFLLQCMKVKSESGVSQSCPTLCDPMDCSPSGSSVRGDFPGKSTRVGCHCLLQKSCPILCDSMDCSPPGSSVHGIFLGKNTRVSCYFLLQRILLTQGLNPHLWRWQAYYLPLSHQESLCT